MNMMLGIFSFMTEALKSHYNADTYPFTRMGLIDNDTYLHNMLMAIVSIALSRCNKCYFALDGIFLPLTTNCVTCKELLFILEHPYLLDKVVFIRDKVEMTNEDALKYLGREDLIINQL